MKQRETKQYSYKSFYEALYGINNSLNFGLVQYIRILQWQIGLVYLLFYKSRNGCCDIVRSEVEGYCNYLSTGTYGLQGVIRWYVCGVLLEVRIGHVLL